ncbi:hypothetical protein RND81_07G006200 [Saponaria officinalis]|uniref:DUF6598 domain-containing protein n=1 Tax=Saponaria officinalis TaxID=3572 RepID=A0AAW1JLM9_SAPOF
MFPSFSYFIPQVPLDDVLASFSPRAQGILEIDDMETEEYDEHYSSDESLSHIDIPWELRPHRNKPSSSPAIEIFSIFIGKEKSKAIQIHGSIEILSEGVRVCYIFRRDRKDALFLSEHMNTAGVLDGSRLYEDGDDLEVKVDVEDAEGSLAIKGYAKWDAEILDSWYRDKQLCSFFQGQNGFFAVHYSVFSNAVLASPKIYFQLKRGSVDKCPTVYGNITSQYCKHFYASRYHQDFYRSVLFMKTQGDAVPLSADGLVPLRQPSVVVPTYSPFIVNVDLSASTLKMSSVLKIEIGDDYCKTIETDDYTLRIEVDWCEIK